MRKIEKKSQTPMIFDVEILKDLDAKITG